MTAQNIILEKEVNLPTQSTTIEDFLKTLSAKHGFSFTYSSNDLPLKKEVHLTAKKQSIKQFLDEIFEGISVRYVERNNKILILIVKRKRKEIPKQTLRGVVTDGETKEPLIGVNIIAIAQDTLYGTTTDYEGVFRFDKIPVGRYSLKFSHVTYESITHSNVLVGSGKEQVFSIELKETRHQLKGVEVSASYYRDMPLNELAVVSSRSFSANETNNYPGALMDISRAAVSFPGVVSNNDGQNHIIIRGNSPKGLQWRLEGIEIPNLNHFAEIGSSGGGVGIINNNMMDNSEFFTGAFPAEYGNALSGVFDLNLRSGNNEKHEKTFQIGIIGTELMMEGPINRSTKSTYAAQYRYSTFKLIKKLDPSMSSIPDFQDISFKVDLPTKKLGKLSIFGIGGLSHEIGDDIIYDWNSNMSTIGVSNDYIINKKTSFKSIFAYSTWHYRWDENNIVSNGQGDVDDNFNSKVSENTLRASLSITRRINSRNKLKVGVILGRTGYDSYMRWYSDSLSNRASDPSHPYYTQDIRFDHVYSDDEGATATGQAFVNWNLKLRDNLTINSGVHFLQFYLNNNYSIEPRFGIRWEMVPRHSLNFGFGSHSRLESLTLYTGMSQVNNGNSDQSNIDLEPIKSDHYVLGYNYSINDDLFFKMEGYYQNIHDVPVFPYPNYFSLINMDFGFEGSDLVNEGSAYNKGIELTLEKFFSKGYYFMLNSTIYDSKYKNYLGEEFDTKYNGSFAANAVLLREFAVGRNKQNALGINSRCIFTGGLRHYPIDLVQSISTGHEHWITDEGYSYQTANYFRVDLQVSYKRNKPKHSSEWRLDILNLTNHRNVDEIRYNNATRSVETTRQNRLIPMLAYRIMF